LSFRSGAFLALAISGAAACGKGPTEVVPAVATVKVEPGSASLDLTDTLRLSATAYGPDGGALPGADLLWRSTTAHASVDIHGVVTALTPGEATIEAVAANGTTGSARLHITPVSGIEPDSGRYGSLITVRGQGLPVDAAVYFGPTAAQRVRAFTRQASGEAVEVWVPVGALDGPLHLVSTAGTVVTRRAFRITAQEDVFAGPEPEDIPFPYHNPSLLARGDRPHAFHFSLPEDTPFSLHLVDRGDRGVRTAVRAWLFRVSPAPATLLSYVMTRDYLARGATLDSVAFSRRSLPAGEYVALVSALDLTQAESAGVRRPFGIRLSAAEHFALKPDVAEPDDFPAEAEAVDLPFERTGLRLENPYAMDHHVFDVAEEGTVRIIAAAADPWLLLYLIPGDQVDILAAWDADAVLAEGEGGPNAPPLEAFLSAGRYTLLVWDWSGRARPYELSVTAVPGGSPVGARANGPGRARAPEHLTAPPDARRAVGRPWAGSVRPERPR
jgi:hypothetical protein